MWILLQASERSAELPGGYGAALLQGLVSLGAVCVLAWLLLRFGARRGLGVGQGKRVKVLERVGLDARRSLYLVEVGGKVLLLGAGDGGAPTLISELDPGELPALPVESPQSFGDVLRRMRGGDASPAGSVDEPEPNRAVASAGKGRPESEGRSASKARSPDEGRSDAPSSAATTADAPSRDS